MSKEKHYKDHNEFLIAQARYELDHAGPKPVFDEPAINKRKRIEDAVARAGMRKAHKQAVATKNQLSENLAGISAALTKVKADGEKLLKSAPKKGDWGSHADEMAALLARQDALQKMHEHAAGAFRAHAQEAQRLYEASGLMAQDEHQRQLQLRKAEAEAKQAEVDAELMAHERAKKEEAKLAG